MAAPRGSDRARACPRSRSARGCGTGRCRSRSARSRIEKATLISTTSGMPLAPVAARMRPFSIDMKPITWPTALRRDTIISRPSRMTDSAKARSSRDERAGLGGDRQHDQDRQRHQTDAGQHGLPDADHGLDVAVDAQPHDDAVQHHRDDDRLDDERDGGGDVEMGRVLDVAPARRPTARRRTRAARRC